MTGYFSARRAAGRVVTALIVGLSTAGCVTPGGVQDTAGANHGDGSQAAGKSAPQAPLTPAEQRMREQSRTFQTVETVATGAAIGALLGLGFGLVKGHEGDDLVKDTAIGAGVGAVAGVGVDAAQKHYANKEDQLNAMIAEVRKSNEETKSLIVSVRQVIAEDKRRLVAVQKKVRRGQATQTELEGARKRIADNKAIIVAANTGAQKRQTQFQVAERQYRKDHPGADTAPMQRELDIYNKNLKTLDGLAKSVSVA